MLGFCFFDAEIDGHPTIDDFAFDGTADLVDCFAESAGDPFFAAQNDGGVVGGTLAVAFEDGAMAGLFLEELIGFIDDDDFVLLEEAETSCFVEDRCGVGAGAVETDDLDFAMFFFDGGLEAVDGIGDEERFIAMEDENARCVVEWDSGFWRFFRHGSGYGMAAQPGSAEDSLNA